MKLELNVYMPDTGVEVSSKTRSLFPNIVECDPHSFRPYKEHGTMVASVFGQLIPHAILYPYNHSPLGVHNEDLVFDAFADIYKRVKAKPKAFHLLNTSFSDPQSKESPLGQKIAYWGHKLVEELGVMWTTSASNSGQDIADLIIPAGFEWAVTVGGMDRAGNKRWSGSNMGNVIDFMGPAEHVRVRGLNGWTYANGTSLAAPYVGAQACKIAEYLHENGICLYPKDMEVYKAMIVVSVDKGPKERDREYGYGPLDLDKLRLLLENAPTPTPLPEPSTPPSQEESDPEEVPMKNNEFEFVVDVGLVWARTPSKMKRIDTIVIHHSGSDGGTVQRIHQQHLADGHAGCDYNYVIELDGTIHKGRGLIYEGGHVSNEKSNNLNERACGICLPGAIHQHAPTAAQVASTKKLISAILALNGKSVGGVPIDVDTIYGHREVPYYVNGKLQAGQPYPTVCPGAYMPMAEFKALLTGEVVVPERRALQMTPKPYMSGPDVTELQTLLLKHGFDPQGIDGVFGPNTASALYSFQALRGLPVTGVTDAATWAALDASQYPEPVDPEPEPEPETLPYYYTYGGDKYSNIRTEPSTRGGDNTVIGRINAGEPCMVLAQAVDIEQGDARMWAELVTLTDAPVYGWCTMQYLKRGR